MNEVFCVQSLPKGSLHADWRWEWRPLKYIQTRYYISEQQAITARNRALKFYKESYEFRIMRYELLDLGEVYAPS